MGILHPFLESFHDDLYSEVYELNILNILFLN